MSDRPQDWGKYVRDTTKHMATDAMLHMATDVAGDGVVSIWVGE